MLRTASLSLVALVAASGLAAPAFGVFRTAQIIAKVGDEVAPGITISSLNQAFVSGNGKVGFTGNLTGGPAGESFVWFDTGIIWRNSDALPDVLSGGEGTMGVGDAGQFIYSPSVNGEDGAWSHNGLVIRGTMADPAQPAKFVTFASRPQMSADGTGYVVTGRAATSGGATTERVLYKVDPSTNAMTPVVQGGDVISGLTVAPAGINFNYSASDNNAHTMTILNIAGAPAASDTMIVKNGAMLMREGSPTGQGDNWQNWRMVAVNDMGDSLVLGDTSAATTMDDFIAYNGAISLRQGQVVDGRTLGATVDAAAINNAGEAIFIWDLAAGEALFYGAANNLSAAMVILQTGDELDINGDNIADVILTDFEASATITQALDFAADGFVYLEVGLTPIGGGAEVNSIIRIAVPAPGAAVVLGLAGLAGLRRRRAG